MTKADKDGWIEHTPGECPIDSATVVQVQHSDGSSSMGRASVFFWGGKAASYTITHYRIIPPVIDAPAATTSSHDEIEPIAADTAMTMRDQFAMAALPALIKAWSWPDTTGIAERAYRYADAMLDARKGGDA